MRQQKTDSFSRCFSSQMVWCVAGSLVSLSGLAGWTVEAADEQRTSVLAEADRLLKLPANETDLVRLIQIDLILSDEHDEICDRVCREILRTLALSGNATAGDHVRSVFENEPERRNVSAWALSVATARRPTDLQDWRFMVRSLTVVSGDDAVSVMTALRRFRIRANKPQWVRQVILTGLRLPEDQQTIAIDLLQHWTDRPKKSSKNGWKLSDYQQWFSAEYPELPEAILPVETPGQRWTTAELEPQLRHLDYTQETLQQGLAVYDKAGCRKCHQRGQSQKTTAPNAVGVASGPTAAPDLTSLGWRRQRSEILKAILFPSHDLDENYPAVTVSLKNGRTFSGVMTRGEEGTMNVMTAESHQQTVRRDEIEQITPLRTSGMPAGSLEPLSLAEIKALFSFLTSIDGVPKPHGDSEL